MNIMYIQVLWDKATIRYNETAVVVG